MRTRSPLKRQRGYALLMLMFFALLIVLSVMAAAPRIATEARREKEEETIWRGKQYVRGIKLFYRKTGHFPTSPEDLTKPKTGIRFMRQAYKDPMNPEGGSWRLIYVGPAGQLIGSVKQHQSSLKLPGTTAAAGSSGPGVAPRSPQNPSGSQPEAGGDQATRTDQQGSSGLSGSSGAPDSSSGSTGVSGTSSGSSSAEQAAPLTRPIVGGNIIGVGSKINRPSLKIYDKGRTYLEWEFIWDPSKDVIQVGQPGTQIGTPIGNPPGVGQNPPLANPPPPSPPNPNPPQPL